MSSKPCRTVLVNLLRNFFLGFSCFMKILLWLRFRSHVTVFSYVPFRMLKMGTESYMKIFLERRQWKTRNDCIFGTVHDIHGSTCNAIWYPVRRGENRPPFPLEPCEWYGEIFTHLTIMKKNSHTFLFNCVVHTIYIDEWDYIFSISHFMNIART